MLAERKEWTKEWPEGWLSRERGEQTAGSVMAGCTELREENQTR